MVSPITYMCAKGDKCSDLDQITASTCLAQVKVIPAQVALHGLLRRELRTGLR